ncbi:MAG: UbiX family flavin prenyltransferase [Ruminococcus sp.]|nr:UbiX family flavin prenyltransferase [Ruminococcus sp.]
MDKKRIVVAATGASGSPLLIQCLKLIKEDSNFRSCLIMSDSARLTLEHETEKTVEELYVLADETFEFMEIGAEPASGSFKTQGMLIVPCSMKTLAGIHGGYAENLILRTADVTLKEQRTLVLAARETPFSAVHLRNMYELSMIPGVRIIPPMLTYYMKPQTVAEMTYHCAAKLVEPFGVKTPDYKRWRGIRM